jgi:cytochrome b6-f complex iron-sulfur subunit
MQSTGGTDRREFIKRALYGILGLLGLGSLIAWLTVLSPRRAAVRALTYVPLLPEEEVPRQGVRKKELVYSVDGQERRGRVFVVAAAGGFSVLSAVCSHLGCLVNYNKAKQEFLCPCHGGRYDLAGKNIAGPPPAPLTKLPHRVENGMVLVGIRA